MLLFAPRRGLNWLLFIWLRVSSDSHLGPFPFHLQSSSEAADNGPAELDAGGGLEAERRQGRQWANSVHTAVTDKIFWAYGKMLLFVAGITLDVGTWAEGCPCNPQALLSDVGLKYYWKRKAQRKLLRMSRPFPF